MGGDPATQERSRVRKEFKAVGPVGFLLESMRLQPAAMDEQYTMKLFNQPSIALTKARVPQLATLVRQLATRGRASKAEDERMKTRALEEIEKYTTDAEHNDKINETNEKSRCT